MVLLVAERVDERVDEMAVDEELAGVADVDGFHLFAPGIGSAQDLTN